MSIMIGVMSSRVSTLLIGSKDDKRRLQRLTCILSPLEDE